MPELHIVHGTLARTDQTFYTDAMSEIASPVFLGSLEPEGVAAVHRAGLAVPAFMAVYDGENLEYDNPSLTGYMEATVALCSVGRFFRSYLASHDFLLNGSPETIDIDVQSAAVPACRAQIGGAEVWHADFVPMAIVSTVRPTEFLAGEDFEPPAGASLEPTSHVVNGRSIPAHIYRPEPGDIVAFSTGVQHRSPVNTTSQPLQRTLVIAYPGRC